MDNPLFGRWFESERARGENADEQQLMPFRQMYERMSAKDRAKFDRILRALDAVQNDLHTLTAKYGDNFLTVELSADSARGPIRSGKLPPAAIQRAIPLWKRFLANRREINRRLL